MGVALSATPTILLGRLAAHVYYYIDFYINFILNKQYITVDNSYILLYTVCEKRSKQYAYYT